MCGRFTLVTKREDLARELGIPGEAIPADLAPRWNIAPSQLVPILLHDGGVRMALFQWGLVPHWAKDPAIGNRMINARSETIAEKPSFKGPLRAQRCLIVADGFYEWHAPGKGGTKGAPRTPYYIRMKDRRPFTFAGLWSKWTAPDGGELLTCTIITGEPNELIADIHHRMPIILPPDHREAWLDPDEHDEDRLLALLGPYDPAAMEMYPVRRHVNSPAHDDPTCVEPAEDESPAG
jgi:putative SOS response-associated peptidase YedK